MEKEIMINSQRIKQLRDQQGWSQEQLAQASGLSLRTIQRVEGEGKASRETKVCLAATFDISLQSLQVSEGFSEDPLKDECMKDEQVKVTNTSNLYDWRNKAFYVLVISTIVSVVCMLIWNKANALSITANITTIVSGIYLGLSWFFCDQPSKAKPQKQTFLAGLIYIALFLIFGSGPHMQFDVQLSAVLSGSIFCVIFYIFAAHTTNKNTHKV